MAQRGNLAEFNRGKKKNVEEITPFKISVTLTNFYLNIGDRFTTVLNSMFTLLYY